MLPNAMIRDKTLTFRARGILCMALSHSEEWVVTKAWVEEQTPEGREAIKTAFRELEQAGYAVLTEQRDMLGKITSKTWTFYDKPVPENERSNFTFVQTTGSDTILSVNGHDLPCSGLPACGEPAAKKTMLSEDKRKEPMPKAARERDELLDTLAEIEGMNPKEITGPVWARLGVSKKLILEATQDCTRDELLRRARKYRVDHPTWTLTANALASHWAELSDESVPFTVNLQDEQLSAALGR